MRRLEPTLVQNHSGTRVSETGVEETLSMPFGGTLSGTLDGRSVISRMSVGGAW